MKTIKTIVTLVLLSLVTSSVVSAQQPTKCGTWRWDVKTITDKEGSVLLSGIPTAFSIDQLVVEQPPRVLHSENMSDGKISRYSSENQVVEIIADVIEVKHELDDSDLHFVLQSTTSKFTMVGEIPDPSCPVFSTFPAQRDHFTKTRADGNAIWEKLKQTKKPVRVKITGVPFWDGVHPTNPTGASKYCREIHPILSIVPVE